jgi:hypothetical protein
MVKNFRMLFLYILISCVLPLRSYALENFDAVYNVTYDIEEDTNTRTTINVALTNTSDRYFAAQYALQVGFDDIENVKASDAGGQLAPKITQNENGQRIELEFNNSVIGKGKTLNFQLTFDTPNVAKKQGKIWEINIPGIANPDKFKDFNVEVKPPQFLGEPLYVKPQHAAGDLKFTKEQLGKSGISLAFGDFQIYDFSIKYHLQNDNIFPIKKSIALPPTTNYQEVFLDQVSPRPENVMIDKDGNWLAEYTLRAGQKIDITAKGKVELYLTPKKEALSDNERKEYLKEERYWEVQSREIQKLAEELKTPENIYKYVTGYLKYDFTRVSRDQKRLGALKALSQKDQAVCLEFTDLFIAIARAAGIPAREVNGFAFTENNKQRPLSKVQDILHSWPEYYDAEKGTWIMVDPTWGNTTGGIDYFHILDLDHFVFVRKGLDSTNPIPAGGYKTTEKIDTKDLLITFSTVTGVRKEELALESLFSKAYSSQLPITGKIQVTNTGTTLIRPLDAKITSRTLTPESQIATLAPIPPYGKQDVNITFDGLPLLTNKNYEFTIDLKDKSESVVFHVAPFNLTRDRLAIFIYVIIGAITIWAATQGAWRLLIHRRKK